MAIAQQDTSTGGSATTTTQPTVLKIGSRSGDVQMLQKWLTQLGYNTGTADGVFGQQTATALKQFQQASGLTADAIYGAQSSAAIQNAILAQKAQNQPDYYAVTQGTPQAPVASQQAQAQPDYYAVAPTTTVSAPPTSQQLGAEAQRQQLAQSGQLGMLTPDQVAGINQFNQKPLQGADVPVAQSPDVTTMGGLRQAEQAQEVSQATMADMKLAEESQSIQQAQASLGVSGGLPTNKDNAPTVTPTGTNVPADTTTSVPQAPALVSASGGMRSTTAPSQTVLGASAGLVGASGGVVSPEVIANTSNMTSLQAMSDELFNRMATMTSEWQPETDVDYQRDAMQLENQVSQMMVARGGLYSSVARAALQSSLVDLQSNYRKQAYERFTEERNFTFQQLQFVSNRIDAEFEKAITLKNYELAVQKEQFDQKMAIAQFNADQAYKKAQLSISRANAENARRQAQYQQELAQSAQAQQNQYNYYNNLSAQATGQTAQFNKYMTEWQQTGQLSTDAASFLGTSWTAGNTWSGAVQAFANKRYEIDNLTNTANTGLRSLGDAEVTLGTYNGFYEQSTAPKSTATKNIIRDENGNVISETTQEW